MLISEVILLFRVSEAYSERGEPKKFKVRTVMANLAEPVQTLLTTFFPGHGGSDKTGIAPRGGAARELRNMLEHLAGGEDQADGDD